MHRLKILIVEDNAVTAMRIKEELLRMGHHVTGIAAHHDAALRSIEKQIPSLILMDIQLKKEQDGITLAQTILQRYHAIALLYLTSYSDEATVSRAMQTDPVAYLNKPFRSEDLRVAIQIAAHRITQAQKHRRGETALKEGYSYDDRYGQLYHHGIPVKLSEKERLLLSILLDAEGVAVSYRAIEAQLWQENLPRSESALRTVVYKLHKKLGYKPIEAIPSYGYRIDL